MRTAGHPNNLLHVIRHIGLLQYPRKIIQLGEARSKHTDCVLDPVGTDDHTATSRSYLEVVRNVLLLHRRAERGAKLVRELIKQRLDTRDSSSSIGGVIVSIDERLDARALERNLGPFTVHEQRGRAFVRVERRIVERQVLLEYDASIKVAVAAKQSTTRVHVLEVQLIEDRVFTLQLLRCTPVRVERRVGGAPLSERYLNRC